MKLFEELQWRGLVKQTTSPEVERLLNEEKITFYCGFDPTADSLHVGSLLPLITMKRLQARGHTPLALAGGATGFVGDPSFKNSERAMLSKETIQKNLVGIKSNIKQILGEVELVNNFDWIKNLSLLDFLKFQGKHFTINSMIAKESVKDRIEDPSKSISFTEFTYPLLQAEDFRHLFLTKNCIAEFGGSDQWTNILAGIDLIRKTTGKEAFGLTFPLLTKSDGTKFGKSESGNVWLTESKTSVFDFFQFFIKTADADVIDLLKKMTFLGPDEIKVLEKETTERPHLRMAQKALAMELTALVHGKEAMEAALAQTQKVFSNNAADAEADLTIDKETALKTTVVDLLVQMGLSSSKGAARRDMNGGGIRINDIKVLEDRQLSEEEVSKALVLSKGKGQKKVLKFF